MVVPELTSLKRCRRVDPLRVARSRGSGRRTTASDWEGRGGADPAAMVGERYGPDGSLWMLHLTGRRL